MPGLVDVHATSGRPGRPQDAGLGYLANLAYGGATNAIRRRRHDVLAYRDLVETGQMSGRVCRHRPGSSRRTTPESRRGARLLKRYSSIGTPSDQQYMAGSRQHASDHHAAKGEADADARGRPRSQAQSTQILDGTPASTYPALMPLYKDVVRLVAESGIVYTPTCSCNTADRGRRTTSTIHRRARDKDASVRTASDLDSTVLRRPWFHDRSTPSARRQVWQTSSLPAQGRARRHGQRQGSSATGSWAIASGGFDPRVLKVERSTVPRDRMGRILDRSRKASSPTSSCSTRTRSRTSAIRTRSATS